jgi:hypothetical protein
MAILEPYSLEDVIRAELESLRPDSGLARPLNHQKAPERGIMTRTREELEFYRETLTGKQPEQTRPVEALSPPLTQELFGEKLTALCLSGGGIRSASFCLGVLQALAQRKLLTSFDYLSTVSGGGYIGGWLTAWGSRNGWNMAGVQMRIGDRNAPPQVTKLRDFTNYLTPRAGLMSADTWVGFAIIARNLALNWSLFLPLVLLTVAAPKFVAASYVWLVTRPDLQPRAEGFAQAVTRILLAATCAYGVAVLFISIELLKTQAQKSAEDAGDALRSSTSTGGSAQPEDSVPCMLGDRPDEPYGVGNVVSALTIVSLITLSAGVSTSIFTTMHLALTWWHYIIFGLLGGLIWLLAFGAAYLLIMLKPNLAMTHGRPIVTDDAKSNFWKLALTRMFGGVAFGLALLIGFSLLGEFVGTHDDRYGVVLGLLIFIASHLVGGMVFSGLSSGISRMDDALEWSARSAGWLLAASFAWMLYATLVLVDPTAVTSSAYGYGKELLAAVGGVSGFGAALYGYSQKTSAEKGTNASRSKGFNWTWIALLGAIVFLIVLIWECSYLFDHFVLGESFAKLIQQRSITGLHFRYFLGALFVLALWSFVASVFVNVNKFSLHGFYRNRLIRAYLGASNLARHPNAFTGFDQADNIEMGNLHSDKPMLIVNTALNLVHGDNLAWQERKASSFTISRIASGNLALGYRRSSEYGQEISLGTAIAISGAAVSPNMGYHSSPLLTFVMTLFNARLGWWLGNPRREAWDLSGPRQAFVAILMELFGYTTDTNRFIYLSDGGHFENLGVYEMLLRRCRTIVAIDAGCDPDLTFEDLGNLVRKARIDFGVEIKFPEPLPPINGAIPTRLGLVNRPDELRAAPYCIVGEISYPWIEEKGSLIYIKAAIHGDEPEDVWSYASSHPEFPHESTGDQFFTESQFESYRQLGLYIGSRVMGGDGEGKSDALELETRAKASVARG